MTSNDTHAQLRRYLYAEHWKIGTIAHQLGVHPDTVRKAIEAERLHSTPLLRSSIVDPYVPFLRQTLEQYPDLRATRLYLMIRQRDRNGSSTSTLLALTANWPMQKPRRQASRLA